MIRFQNNVFSKQKIGLKKATGRFCARSTTGFTLVEILVVVAVLALISAVLIVYSRTSESQIAVFKEQAEIIGILSRAKSLAIATFGEAGVPCGYGVHFEADGTFLIFEDLADNCQLSDHKYSGSQEIYQSFNIGSSLRFDTLSISDVLFVPPDPLVFISPLQDEATISIKSIDGNASATIKINSAGQISS